MSPRWCSGKDAGIYLGWCRDWIEERGVKWQKTPVPGKIRYKRARVTLRRRYFFPDLDPMNLE
jgi:hypothetical protein